MDDHGLPKISSVGRGTTDMVRAMKSIVLRFIAHEQKRIQIAHIMIHDVFWLPSSTPLVVIVIVCDL